MKERVTFVLKWERRWNEAQGGPLDLAELCRKYGVSRPTGYAWLKRFRDARHDLRVLEEKSRRPRRHPQAISAVGGGPEDGQWCHVLTLLDADTRYLLRAEAMLEPDGKNVEKVLDSAFQEFWLPKAMRSDNGPPSASTGAGRLSRLSVWWSPHQALGEIAPALVYRRRDGRAGKDRGGRRRTR